MRIGGGVFTWGGGAIGFGAALLLALFLYSQFPAAEAASFDCIKAELPLDKLICQNPELSKLDEKMAASYHADLVQLSPDGQTIFRASQRQWLGAVRQRCKIELDNSKDHPTENAVACLRYSYGNRISDLKNAISKIGMYRLMTVYITEFDPEYASSGYGAMFPDGAWASLAYPRIDSPPTTGAKVLNKAWLTEAGDPKGTVESGWRLEQHFAVELEENDYIRIVTRSDAWWASGVRLPPVETRWNILLPALRELQPEDLFRKAAAWKDGLQRRCEIVFFARYPDLAFSDDLKKRLAPLCIDPRNWVLSPQSLTILPDPYSGFAKGDQPGDYQIVNATIPWRDLKPYLRADLPIKLNTE